MSDEYDIGYDDSTDDDGGDLSKVRGKKGFSLAWDDGRTPERQCTAHRTNGEPCRRAAINGGSVCATHGGRAPAVKAKAKARLDMAADKLAKELLHIAIDDGAPAAVKLAAIRDGLDRAGLAPKQAVELEVGPTPAWQQVMDGISGGSRAESRARRGLPLDEVDRALVNESSAENSDGDGPACAACGRPYPAELLAWVEDVPEICRECRESRELEPAFGDRGPTRDPLGFAPDLPGNAVREPLGGLGGVDGYAAPTTNVDGEQSNGFLTHEQAVAAERQANRRGRRR